MVTDYEKYLILMGMNMRENDQVKEDRIADDLDYLWRRLSEYQRGCSRDAAKYANQIADKVDGNIQGRT